MRARIIFNGKRYRSFEQLYNANTKGRTMTVRQAVWFLEDNAERITITTPAPRHYVSPCDFGYCGNTAL